MNMYVFKSKYGVAVINAKSKEDALRRLKLSEGEEYLSFKAKPEDFELAPDGEGLIVYFAN